MYRNLEPGETVRWSQFYNNITGKIPVRIRPDVLESDEAIVAIFTHELHELNRLRQMFTANSGVMSAENLYRLVEEGFKNNLHDEAWDLANQAVLRMRGG